MLIEPKKKKKRMDGNVLSGQEWLTKQFDNFNRTELFEKEKNKLNQQHQQRN